MDNKMIDRCKVICGGATDKCVIDNTKHLDCIADMVLNKTFCISLLLNRILKKGDPGINRENIQEAITIANELSNWVKYLQVTRNLKHLNALHLDIDQSVKRRSTRYPLPEMYRDYISMELALPGRMVPVDLLNFCQRGTQFQCPEPLELDSAVDCTLTTIYDERKQARLKLTVRYCSLGDEEYLIGAHIDEIADSVNFNFFNNVFDFITEIEK